MIATKWRDEKQVDEPSRTHWHTLSDQQTLEQLQVQTHTGLTDTEVTQRRQQYGPNELIERGAKSPWWILWEQLTAIVTVVLLVAAGVKAWIGGYTDAIAILTVIVLNVVLGFIQEYRAEKAMAALKRLAAPLVRVRRNGQISELKASELVPGDIIFLEAGNAIPADARLFEATNLRVQEASLTGESQPVDKTPAALPTRAGRDVPLGDRHNMLYLGTTVTYGRGTAVVAETGMRTELGRIAELIQSVPTTATPLQKRIKQLGIGLAVSILVIVGLVFALGVVRGAEMGKMFMAGVAIAVAAIPEGLPAVLTITLALGAQRMLRRRALIRKLPAVETLGSVTVICSDKTGTLTENRMQVKILDVAGHTADLTEAMRRGHPVLPASDVHTTVQAPAQALLLAAGALCNDAILEPDATLRGGFHTVGDPTEGALLVAAAHFGFGKTPLEQYCPRIGEVPFSSERRCMTTVHQRSIAMPPDNGLHPFAALLHDTPHTYVAFTKGAVDSLLHKSEQVWVDGVAQPLTDEWRARIEAASDRLAQEGLRTLGMAWRSIEVLPAPNAWETVEQKLTFIGMVGMVDPPRPEVKQAVLQCQSAGIRPVMITGDHPLTALQIARELHIVAPTDSGVLTGQELSRMSPQALAEAVGRVSVYARVSPEDKLNIVEALQKQGHIVAMTGDGVNDAPALRKSDIGVAMGIAGTDVSKEAADMVITDDNFATIVHAVEEGRTIYDNVRKFVKYIVTSNSAEVTVMFLSQVFGMALPMTTLQILWMNLVTDGVPGLALGMEPTERDTMRRPPYAPGESIFSRGIGRHVIIFGLLLALVSFSVGYWGWSTGNPAWGTMIFVTLTLSQLGHALAVRSNRESFFRMGLFSNPVMLLSVVVTCVLQMAVVYAPPLQRIFETVALGPVELGVSLAASMVIFWGVELEKWYLRRVDSRHERLTFRQRGASFVRFLGRAFERLLWESRLMVLAGVVASVVIAAGVFYITTIDVIHLFSYLTGYTDPTLTSDLRANLRTEIVTYIVKAIDGYLIAAILLIFALGLYELFISRINIAEHAEAGPRLLRVQGLDDLKDRVAKLVLLVLVIEFFQQALKLKYTEALDLLYLAMGILLIAAAFFLSSYWPFKKGQSSSQDS